MRGSNMFKKLLKNLILWIILSEALVLFILYLQGFRITYAPKLENDWNAIGAIGQWASAVVGIFVPIAIVFIQYKLDTNKKEIGEANLQLYKDIEELKDKFIRIDMSTEDSEEIKRTKLKLKAQKIIDIGLLMNTKGVADQIGLNVEETYMLLEEMFRHDRSIGAAGQVRKERMNNIIWTPKSKR